jgi:rhamnosyltransferase
MLRLPHVPIRHKAKFLVSLPVRLAVHLVHHRFSRDCVTALANGLVDGVRNRLGPPDRALIPWWSTGLRAHHMRNAAMHGNTSGGQHPA